MRRGGLYGRLSAGEIMISWYNVFSVATCGALGGKKREARRLDVCRAEPITCCSWIKYTYVADSKKPSERQQCEGKPAHALRMLTTHVYTKGRRYR